MAMSMAPATKKSIVTKIHRQTSVSSNSGSALLGSGASTSSSRGSTGLPPSSAVLADITQHTTSPYASTCASEEAARHQQCDHTPIADGAFSVKRASSMRPTTPGRSDHGGRSMIGRSARDASAKLESTSQRAGPMRDSENQSTPSRKYVPFNRDTTVDIGSRGTFVDPLDWNLSLGDKNLLGTSGRRALIDRAPEPPRTARSATPFGSSNSMLPPASRRVPTSAAPTALLRKVSSKAESSAPLKRKLIAVEAIDSTVQGASVILAGAPPKPRTKSLTLTASACHSTLSSQTRSPERRRSLSSGVRATGPAPSLLTHGAKRVSSRHVASTSIFSEPTSTASRLSRAPSMSLRASTAQRSAIPLSSTRMVKKGSGLSGTSSIGEVIGEEPTNGRTMNASSETTPAQSFVPPAPSTTQSARRKKNYASLSLKPKMGSPAQQFLPDASVPHSLRSHSGSNRSVSTAASIQPALGDISPSTTRPARQRQRQRQSRDSWETVPISSRRTSFAPSIVPQERTSILASTMPAPCPSSAPALLKLSIGPPESIAGDVSWESIAQDRPTPAFDVDSDHTPSRFEGDLRVNESDGLPSRSAISYASPDHEKLHAALRRIAPTPAKPDGTEEDPTLGLVRGAHRVVGRGSTTLEELFRTTLLGASRSHADAGPDRDTWLTDGSVGETMRADLNTATMPSTPLQLSLNQIVRDPSAVAILRDDFDRTYARAQDLEFVVAQQARELEDLRTTEAAQRTRAEALGREGDASTMRLDAMAKVIDELEQELEQARSAKARTTDYLALSDAAAANGKIIAEAVSAISMTKHVAEAFAHLNQVAHLQREDVGDQMRALEVMKRGFELMTSA